VNQLDTMGIVLGDQMDHPGFFGVNGSSPQLFKGNALPHDFLDDPRSGDEHLGVFSTCKMKSIRAASKPPARTGAHDGRNLGTTPSTGVS